MSSNEIKVVVVLALGLAMIALFLVADLTTSVRRLVEIQQHIHTHHMYEQEF